MKELDYQIDAIRKLKQTSNDLLKLYGNHTIVFKAPTGSGKTVMIAEFLKEFVSNRNDSLEFSFIWAAPRKLHTQSKKKLIIHYKDSMAIKCSDFDDLSDRLIGPNEILFLNWESIYQENNIYYRENEQEFYLEKVIENTKDDDRIVILIIDESHHTAGAENTQSLIGMMNAKLTIEVSATPLITGDEIVKVYRQKVIDEEMIKKSISINPDFKNSIISRSRNGDLQIQSGAEESTNEFIIRTALEKRKELEKLLSVENSSVNPLMLIQLPDRRQGQVDFKETVIDILKDNHEITIENGRLAIYLSGDDNKDNLNAIEKHDNPVVVMIFKQAIALGWDCPRASILVLFRDWQSIVFSIQTVGRIMRMPELKHYVSNDLNISYIYTNLSDISIHQDIADGYATVFNSLRNNDIYTEIELLSCHSLRQRERTRLSPNFIKYFLSAAKELDLRHKITTDITEISNQLISDGIITNLDEEFEHLQEVTNTDFDPHSGNNVFRKLNEEEIQILFDQFSIDILSPLYPEERSIKRINTSIYEFFKKEFPQQFDYAGVKEQMTVLAKINRQHFINTANLAKENYLADVEKRSKEIVIDKNWEIPKSLNFSEEYIKKDYGLSIMQPFFEKVSASNIEKKFAIFLNDQNNDISWWFKNGERDGTFFAVPRKDSESDVPFYVDWIVKYKDGRLGLFDTKGGLTAETAGSRAVGLANYIKEQNEMNKNLFGGIIIEKDRSFWLNSNDEYKYNENDLLGSGWVVLN